MTAKPQASRKRRMQLGPRHLVAIVAALVVIVFIVQNRDTVTMYFITAVITAPLWIGFLVVAALGMLAGYLMARRRR